MPDRQRVLEFIDRVVSGDHVGAIEDYYHPDASMQENGAEPRRGRDALVAHEAAVLERMTMHTHPVATHLVDGDLVVIRWTFDMTDAAGVTRRLEEVSLQRWVGDRIMEERFFYDPSAARKPLEDG